MKFPKNWWCLSPETESGASGGMGASEGSEENPAGGAGGELNEHVSKADHLRALEDLKRFKAEAKALKEQQERAKEAEMRKNQEWEALAKKKEEEAIEARQRAEAVEKAFLNDRRYSAVREKAIAMGLRQEALSDLDMLDLSEIEIERTSTGRVNVLGADRFAERLRAMKPHWFGSKTPPNVDVTDPRVNPTGTVTLQQLRDAEKKAKESGDTSQYLDLHKRYKAQLRK